MPAQPAQPARSRSRTRRRLLAAGGLALAVASPAVAHADGGGHGHRDVPRLTGRAVLDVDTYAPGPPSGNFVIPGAGVRNGIQFPLPSQPVEGFSGIVEGREPGEYLAMTDNGFGNKANSRDFNLRAYYLRPDFETARGGSGGVEVRDHIEFTDPEGYFPYRIVNEDAASPEERVLTGADVDPESIQRDRRGDLWIGDEFGPWLLHFDADGRLLEAPIPLPGRLVSPANPKADPDNDPATAAVVPVTVTGSRGIEAMAMTTNGRALVVILEGAVPVDDPASRRVYVFDLEARAWSRLGADYRTEAAGHFVADAQALDRNRLLVIERDGGRGADALFRRVYEIDLRDAAGGTLAKRQVVDLAAIPDPDLISLPTTAGDVGLGDPFRVTCESIEALRIVDGRTLLLGCDNNFPNTGRNPARADDNELILVDIRRR